MVWMIYGLRALGITVSLGLFDNGRARSAGPMLRMAMHVMRINTAHHVRRLSGKVQSNIMLP